MEIVKIKSLAEVTAGEIFTYSLKKTTVTVCEENASTSHVAMTPRWRLNINGLKRYALDHLIPNTFEEDDDLNVTMRVDDDPELTVTDTAIEMVFNVEYKEIESIKITFELNK